MKEMGPVLLNNMKEEIQLKAVKQDGYAIQFIDNPS